MKYTEHLVDGKVRHYSFNGGRSTFIDGDPYDLMMAEVAAGTSTKVEQDDTHVETALDKRMKNLADGGYGTEREQLEMIAEQGVDVFQAHVAKIKQDHPK